MPNIGVAELVIAAPLLILPIVAIVFLLRDRRPGTETAVWVLVIVLAPFLGPIVYLVRRAVEKRSHTPPAPRNT
ncbi:MULTISPECIES: PLD nuclease N-terminal domain-containing protein [unclassified Corynebacterium]|uniref:PLD nuclease N-terminal domain-containing protein n=1 Tax=unclassified Corynebacterium TaxID=2624378 RepID=UPI0029C9F75E|nr:MULTISPECIES: PLD nuclease N-terminal domain-containing protein [unclassified Corynebacterium]WPF65698.1 PLD nuclease N-terminal domain-containing protein [Corynebacterium sp. 22KM0430]WPF68194.1 PLD nuclease N-terminal domain-containing protein [Corynebacterium sp. 21KM1197]